MSVTHCMVCVLSYRRRKKRRKINMRVRAVSLTTPMLEDYPSPSPNTVTLERYRSGSHVSTAKDPQTFDELFTR